MTKSSGQTDRYVALLRGINVGGNRKIPMATLKVSFEALKFRSVKTLLASGNVIFEAPESDETSLTRTIEARLERDFGFQTDVILRQVEYLRRMVGANPFEGVAVSPETRLYVTFLRGSPQGTLEVPYASPDGGFRILGLGDREIFSVVEASQPGRSVDAMGLLEKTYGRKLTTRNWNTVNRITAAFDSVSGRANTFFSK